jgi:hypothetical protein
MKKQIGKAVLVAVLLGTMGVALVEAAVDMTAANGQMADIALLSVKAKSNLAKAAKGDDAQAILVAERRAAAVDQALKDADKAFAKLKNATTGAAKEAAAKQLAAAYESAKQALEGPLPEPISPKGKIGNAYVPNVTDTPWKSDGVRRVSDVAFAVRNVAGGGSFGDRDATPE